MAQELPNDHGSWGFSGGLGAFWIERLVSKKLFFALFDVFLNVFLMFLNVSQKLLFLDFRWFTMFYVNVLKMCLSV